MTLKWCTDCNAFLDRSDFTKNRRNRDGLSFYCAPCSRARVNASRRLRLGPPKTRNGQGPRDLPDGTKWCPECDGVFPVANFPRAPSQANGRGAYCKRCSSRVIEANRVRNHGSTRNYHLKHRYGITADDFDAMFASQGGRCAICRNAKAVHTDHDHASGRVRGLLCFNCNQGLGNFRDKQDVMRAAIDYLAARGQLPMADGADGSRCIYLGPVSRPGRPADVTDEEWEEMFAAIQRGYDDAEDEARNASTTASQ